MAKFKFIDLFAGIGGIRLGFERTGGECVFSSEIDKFACQTYQANFGEYPSGDITKIHAKDIPSFDVLCAGIPCQSFSIAGKQKKFDDPRGQMINHIVRIALYHQPKFIFLENVIGFKDIFKTDNHVNFLSPLFEAGYKVSYKMFNSKDFGVPQNRNRLFIVFSRGEEFIFPESPKIKSKLADILESNVDEKYYLSNKAWIGHQIRKEKNKNNGKGFGYSLVNQHGEYTRTLTARYGKDGSEILIEQECKNPRKLTPRECARLQGFPDSFIIPVSDTQAYKQFGNSVTVPVIEVIAKKISDTF